VSNPTIKRALVSVTDKSGIVDFCHVLVDEFAVQVVSTGGTARTLKDAGIAVTAIEEVTGFPEMMDGRIKTLHPKVHGALLARRDSATHLAAAHKHGIVPIDLVVVNLYAFADAIAQGANEDVAVEHIDIGGPSMLRSAAKNSASVTVLTDPACYDDILAEMREHEGCTTLTTRKKLAADAFALTAQYDAMIAAHLAPAPSAADGGDLVLTLEKIQDLRYGENPHQTAAYYRYKDCNAHSLAAAVQRQGKELSYNNILDTDAAWAAVREFTDPSCVIVKHTNPCGAASDDDLVAAYQKAWAGDPLSAFGGIIALNRPLTAALAQAIFATKQFVEVIIAPSYEDAALELFATKPNLRILETGGVCPPQDQPPAAGSACDRTDVPRWSQLRSVEGGILAQSEDTACEDPATFSVVSKAQPSQQQLQDLLFAWKVCKSVKSNAIVIVKDRAMLGMGAGQPNRVNAARVAISQASQSADDADATSVPAGCVAASDAFVPFPDTVSVLAQAGITALIQPGGSMRDEEVIAAADAAGMVMLATGRRHFRH